MGGILLVPADTVERFFPMMAPFPSSWEAFKGRQWVDRVLYESYRDNTHAGYEVQWGDEWIVNNRQQQQRREQYQLRRQEQEGLWKNKVDDGTVDSSTTMKPSTYGEITQVGGRQLMGAMGLILMTSKYQERATDAGDGSQVRIHFFDLGSGAGKLVCQMGLELMLLWGGSHGNTEDCAIMSTGVELSPTRHEAAVRARQALIEHLRQQSNEEPRDYRPSPLPPYSCIEFVQGDLLEADLSSATHVYVASLCFPLSLMHALESKLVTEAPRLQCVATLQRFPNDLSLSHQRQHRRPVVHYIEMSWTKPFGSAVYVYHL